MFFVSIRITVCFAGFYWDSWILRSSVQATFGLLGLSLTMKQRKHTHQAVQSTRMDLLRVKVHAYLNK